MGERRCTATRRNGKPCRAAPLHGSDRCLAHSDPKTRESVGFVAANGRAGRPPNPRAVDILRERVEADSEKWVAPYEDALSATRDGEPDHAIRLRAAEAVLDRAYGKPKQHTAVELESEDRTPAPIDLELAAEVEQAFRDAWVPEHLRDVVVVPELPRPKEPQRGGRGHQRRRERRWDVGAGGF